MQIIDISSLKPPEAEVATFQGSRYGANVSFFVVQFSQGQGPAKHRHPYEETFLVLDGEIETIVGGETRTVGKEKVAVIPAYTWHEFKNRADRPVLMVNIHPVPKMITEWA